MNTAEQGSSRALRSPQRSAPHEALPSVLLIDDDEVFCRAMSKALRRRGFEVSAISEPEQAISALLSAPQNCVAIVDLKMPQISGLELLQRTTQRQASALMLTGHGGVPEAVEAMRAGAHTFLTKPVDADDLAPLIIQAAREQQNPQAPLLIGESPASLSLKQLITQLAHVKEPILLTGETGTGKEVVARALHAQGSGPSSPFVAVNMACLPRDLIESELFGHVKGAFTGAQSDKRGLFGEARQGFLFLDEVAELPLEHQAKLLRVIEQGEYRPVGGLKAERFQGRLIAATHRDLHAEVRAGRFREDLLYRLQVIPLHLPPLRERIEDIEPIFESWLTRLNVPQLTLSSCARQALKAHPWPGNARELVNLARRLSVFYPQGGEASAEVITQLLRSAPFNAPLTQVTQATQVPQVTQPRPHLPPLSPLTEPQQRSSVHNPLILGADVSLEELERAHIELLIAKYTNVTHVAKILQINRRTLQRKLRSWGMSVGDE